MLVNIELFSFFGFKLTIPEVLAFYQIVFSVIFILGHFREIFYERKNLFVLLFISYLVILALLNIFNFHKLIDVTKILAWALYIPIGYLLFSTSINYYLLRKYLVISAVIIVSGVLLAQYYKSGVSAYDLGVIYLGSFPAEAPLGSSLVTGIIVLFLPRNLKTVNFRILFTEIVLFLILASLILMLMVRSMILAMLIFSICYFLFAIKKKYLQKFFVIVAICMTAFVCLSILFSLKPEYISVRFRDVRASEHKIKIDSVGSGRVSLLKRYWREFSSQDIMTQIFGTNFYIMLDQSATQVFKEKRMGTHNDALQLLFIGGYVSLILYIIMWVAIIGNINQKLKKKIDSQSRKLQAVTVSSIIIYILLSFHGIIFHIYLMQVMSVIIGISLSGLSLKPLDEELTVA